MFLTIQGPAGYEETSAVDNDGLPLGVALGIHAATVELCLINGRLSPKWKDIAPSRGDRVILRLGIGEPATITAITTAVINAVIASVVSAALSAIVMALTPKPKKPKADGSGRSYGITGFQNTTGQGTPILRAYGTNRIYPHVIASGVDVINQRDMVGKILFCVGASDDNGWEELSDVLINAVPADQFDGLQIHYRLGTPDQTVIPGFEDSYNVWNVSAEIPYDDTTHTGTTFPYTTKSDDVNLIKVIFSFPGGLWRRNASGQRHEEFIDLLVQISVFNANQFLAVEPIPEHRSPNNPTWWRFRDSIASIFYDGLLIDTSFANPAANNRYWADYPDVAASPVYGTGVPGGAWKHYNGHGRAEGRIWHSELHSGAQYDLHITVMAAGTLGSGDSHSITIFLFDVEERVYQVSQNYPNRVLLGLTNLPAKQVPSLEGLQVSVLAKCQRVKEYLDPSGTSYALKSSRKRCWNVAHFLTNQRIGMGYEVDEAEIPVSQWYTEAQSYYDQLVPAQAGGTEPRDCCDWMITERRWDWDHIKQCVGEGRAILIPSNGFWKWLVDKPGAPQLLFSEPGNIVEGSISMEIAPPDRPWNQIISEFRDEQDQYRPGITQPVNGPDFPYPSTIQEAVSFDTITRESHAMRECMVMLKRQFLEKRRWTFTSPQSAIIKEPLDVDWLCERVIGDEGAYTGFLPEGSSTTVVLLDRLVELLTGEIYILIIQFRDGSPAQSRTVTTGPGKTMAVTVSSAFTRPPAENDVYALGVQNVDHVMTRLRDMTIDNEGRVQQIRTEYVEEVYDPDPLPPSINPKLFPYGASLPPLPLQGAAVVNQLVLNADGSWRTVILFDVTPSLTIHSGTTWTGALWADAGLSVIDITFERGGPNDPYAFNMFLGADYYPTANSPNQGLHRRIALYNAANFQAFFETPFPNPEGPGYGYEIRWPRFGEFDGFKVERSQDNITFSEVARFKGIHGEMDGGDQTGTWFFRFTPFSPGSIENKVAQIIRPVTLIGDRSAPAAPLSIVATSQYKTVTAIIVIALPMAEDIKNLDIEYYQRADAIGNLIGVFVSAPAVTRVNASSGTWPIVATVNLVQLNYGATIIARARAVDYSGNASPWTNFSNDVVLSQVISPDLGTGAVASIAYYRNEGVIGLASEGGSGPTLTAVKTIGTVGKSLNITAKVLVRDAFGSDPSMNSHDTGGKLYLVRGDTWPGYGSDLILDTNFNSGMLLAADNLPPGTWTYTIWGESTASYITGGAEVYSQHMTIQENRGGFDAPGF